MLDDSAYILVDATGSRTQTTLVDLNDRKSYSVIPSMNLPHQCAVQIYRIHAPKYVQNVRSCSAAFSTMAQNAPGTIWIEGWKEPIQMTAFLARSNAHGSKVTCRSFTASDGQVYRWSRRLKEDQEWTCTNVRNYAVAHYTLASELHPKSHMVIDATFIHLDVELIVTLFAMRVMYN